MKKSILTLMLLLSITAGSYAADRTAVSVNKLINDAIYIMDKGDYDKSISMLTDITKKYPKHYIANYELAYAHYLKKDYKNAIRILKKLEKNPDITDMLYQMLGNAYDLDGNPNKALETYFNGLKKFPASGKLYLEAGNIYKMYDKSDVAIKCYEKGIEVDHEFPSNYFRAAELLCNSDEKVFGLIYGEILVNMQPESPRAKIMSKILFDTYKNSIDFHNDTIIKVSFTKNNEISFDKTTGKLQIPFEIIYEISTSKAIPAFKENREINLGTLHEFRDLFIDDYFKSGNGTNLLFDYHKKLREAGHFEAYNMWLLREGSSGEFDLWVSGNEKKFLEFNKWYKENPLAITSENRFSRETASKTLLIAKDVE